MLGEGTPTGGRPIFRFFMLTPPQPRERCGSLICGGAIIKSKGVPAPRCTSGKAAPPASQHVAHVGCVRRIGKDGVPESLCRYVRSHGDCEHVYQFLGFCSQEMGTQYAIIVFVDQHFEARAILSDSPR